MVFFLTRKNFRIFSRQVARAFLENPYSSVDVSLRDNENGKESFLENPHNDVVFSRVKTQMEKTRFRRIPIVALVFFLRRVEKTHF